MSTNVRALSRVDGNAAAISAHETVQDRVNRRAYHHPRVARLYRDTTLDPPETVALLMYQPAFAGRSVLDLGIGSGRTSRYLAALSAHYEGLDYSPQMIRFLRERMPHIPARLGDMRDLSAFAGGTFDFVMASCNVIDAVSHTDRLTVLAEVRRVLAVGGLFMFSSHNRHVWNALSGPRLNWSRNPGTMALHVARYVRSLMHHAHMKHERRLEEDYALLNDPGHDYAVLHYYIDRDAQMRQLERAGFRLHAIFDSQGRSVIGTDDDRASPSLLYVAERCG